MFESFHGLKTAGALGTAGAGKLNQAQDKLDQAAALDLQKASDFCQFIQQAYERRSPEEPPATGARRRARSPSRQAQRRYPAFQSLEGYPQPGRGGL